MFKLHQPTRVFRQRISVPDQVMPIQGSERACALTGRVCRVIAAAFAMIAHAVNVFATGDIRLARHQPTVGKLADADGDGPLHPLGRKRKPITSSQRDPGDIPYSGASGIVDYVKDYIFELARASITRR